MYQLQFGISGRSLSKRKKVMARPINVFPPQDFAKIPAITSTSPTRNSKMHRKSKVIPVWSKSPERNFQIQVPKKKLSQNNWKINWWKPESDNLTMKNIYQIYSNKRESYFDGTKIHSHLLSRNKSMMEPRHWPELEMDLARANNAINELRRSTAEEIENLQQAFATISFEYATLSK